MIKYVKFNFNRRPMIFFLGFSIIFTQHLFASSGTPAFRGT